MESSGSIGNGSGDWTLHWNILIIPSSSAWIGKLDLYKGQNYVKKKKLQILSEFQHKL